MQIAAVVSLLSLVRLLCDICRYSKLKNQGSISPHSLRVGLCIVISFQIAQCGNEREFLQWRNLTDVTQVIKVNISNDKSCWQHAPSILAWWKWYCTSLIFLAKIYNSSLIIRKGLSWWLISEESVCNTGDAGDVASIPGSGRSLGGGHGNRLQYSCLENPKDRGA